MALRYGPKTKKWQIKTKLHGTILEGKSIGSDPPTSKKKELKRRAHD
jgi:hypothetical protein